MPVSGRLEVELLLGQHLGQDIQAAVHLVAVALPVLAAECPARHVLAHGPKTCPIGHVRSSGRARRAESRRRRPALTPGVTGPAARDVACTAASMPRRNTECSGSIARAAVAGRLACRMPSARASACGPAPSRVSTSSSPSLPRSMAIVTIRSKVFSGVNTRASRGHHRVGAPVAPLVADPAAQALQRVDDRPVLAQPLALVVDHRDGVGRAGVEALLAAPALVEVDVGDPVRGDDRAGDPVPADRLHHPAAAAAAVAHVADAVLDVVGGLRQPGGLRRRSGSPGPPRC